MLATQLLVFVWTLSSWPEATIFCTGPATGLIPWLFGLLHFGFLGLLLFGFASLKWSRARPVYLIGLCVCLAALPVQARLVQRQILSCDAP